MRRIVGELWNCSDSDSSKNCFVEIMVVHGFFKTMFGIVSLYLVSHVSVKYEGIERLNEVRL